MKFTNILYDINKNELEKNVFSNSSTFYFYSYQIISATIVSGNGILYSAKQNGPNIDVTNGQTLNNNFGYTLYIPVNNSKIVIKITNQQNVETLFTIVSKFDNIIDETNEHYNDLLVNYNLPSFEQLKAAIPDDFDESEILKRLFLDFRNILKYKGSKKSIEQFLNFIGFADKNLTISDLYKNQSGELILIPDKTKDTKSGKYSVTYDNYVEGEGYDSNNLPLREFIIQNIDNFKVSLMNAIVLANTYFTAEEQEIIFFGLNYSSNSPIFSSITSNMSTVFENDVYGFQKELVIDVFCNETKTFKNILVKNTLQKNNKAFSSECKTVINSPQNNSEIFFVDEELFDEDSQVDFVNFVEIFGVVLHLDINSPNTFIKFTIENRNNPLSLFTFNKTHIDLSLNKLIALTEIGNYTLTIWITDAYNNTEKYFYDFSIDINSSRIDFDSFNSRELGENNLTLDIDSDSEVSLTSTVNKNYILPLDVVPDDLSLYYNFVSSLSRYLKKIDRYILPDVNQNNAVNDLTESIPLELLENWLNIVSFKYDPLYDLKIRVYDANKCTFEIVSIENLKNYHPELDILYCVIMDIYDRNSDDSIQSTKTPYYFITSIETGIDFDETIFDFVLVNKNTPTDIKSIYSLDAIVINKIAVNYDFQLFPILSELVPTFIPYISEGWYNTKLNEDSPEYVTVKSVFPRLINISETLINTYKLKLDDVFVCKLNENYVVNYKNIVWKVYNTFTNELLFTTNDLTLKYRVEENICYDISCEISINNKQYQIYKKSVFSSFESTI